ncbi:hypothetical protein CXB51_025986 [Gossypium anomalum]|uniref:Uncharacterized protein n=1 Tax=Gossypium anomalum TaxID=47600 RepID=A0A8J6CV78_9ROSI|nr:hypothetical protein CXB51_025986 [Gossypium anomalum]
MAYEQEDHPKLQFPLDSNSYNITAEIGAGVCSKVIQPNVFPSIQLLLPLKPSILISPTPISATLSDVKPTPPRFFPPQHPQPSLFLHRRKRSLGGYALYVRRFFRVHHLIFFPQWNTRAMHCHYSQRNPDCIVVSSQPRAFAWRYKGQ